MRIVFPLGKMNSAYEPMGPLGNGPDGFALVGVAHTGMVTIAPESVVALGPMKDDGIVGEDELSPRSTTLYNGAAWTRDAEVRARRSIEPRSDKPGSARRYICGDLHWLADVRGTR